MIDIAAESKLRDISYIVHVTGGMNIADGLTKKMIETALLDVLRTGKLNEEATQWIIRKPK